MQLHQAVTACLCRMQDEATPKELAATDVSLVVKGVLQRVHDHCFELDVVAAVTSSQALMQG